MIKDSYIQHLKQTIYRNGKATPLYYGYDFFKSFNELESSRLDDFDGDIWFISDHHFNHKNIIQYSERPFRDLLHMETCLIEQHNDMVKPNDIAVLVGDFGFCNMKIGKQILSRMNGYKIFILGNHDVYHNKFKNFGYDEVYSIRELVYNNQKFIITHYPFKGCEETHTNIHGHIHKGRVMDDGFNNHFNVNCEFINYTPIHITKIIEEINVSIND